MAIEWNNKVWQAVGLVNEDKLTVNEIAVTVGVEVPTIQEWIADVAFQNEIKLLRKQAKERLRKEGIRAKENRLAAQHDRWEALKYIVKERKEDFKDKKIPGGESGFIVRRYARDGINYEFDDKLFKAFSELEKHVAQEVGDWVEKRELNGKLDVTKLSDEELAAIVSYKG